MTGKQHLAGGAVAFFVVAVAYFVHAAQPRVGPVRVAPCDAPSGLVDGRRRPAAWVLGELRRADRDVAADRDRVGREPLVASGRAHLVHLEPRPVRAGEGLADRRDGGAVAGSRRVGRRGRGVVARGERRQHPRGLPRRRGRGFAHSSWHTARGLFIAASSCSAPLVLASPWLLPPLDAARAARDGARRADPGDPAARDHLRGGRVRRSRGTCTASRFTISTSRCLARPLADRRPTRQFSSFRI